MKKTISSITDNYYTLMIVDGDCNSDTIDPVDDTDEYEIVSRSSDGEQYIVISFEFDTETECYWLTLAEIEYDEEDDDKKVPGEVCEPLEVIPLVVAGNPK